MIATENKEEIEQKIVVIGKVLPNRWEYKQIEVIGNKEIEETGIIVVGDNDVKEINRNRLYLQLIIEIKVSNTGKNKIEYSSKSIARSTSTRI